MSTGQTQSVGTLLRDWRQRRRMSQLDLACEAEISTRHLSFLETGRSQPSREMLLHLAERLEVPLRERNLLLVAAGYAPVFPERPLDDPALLDARRAISLVLAGHEPYPALAIDRHWNLQAANNGVAPFLADVAPALLQPPVNVLRLSLHPEGLAPRIVNLAEWRAHVLARLRRQIDLSGDQVLADLLEELAAYPFARAGSGPPAERSHTEAVVSLQLLTPAGRLTFFSTTMVFGTPIDITLSELALES
ncbi:MAG TPA: helix-turn-helix transcriptional regulator, partial [Herpetosiphonaceae bacterium]|nr:helix-turn-helix transcriptional regulator [Herpetosiphonaceae bacterium]